MTEYIVNGPHIPLIKDHMGLYMFNKLKSQDPSEVMMVSVDSNEEYTAEDIKVKSTKLAIALSKHIKQGDIIAAVCENDNAVILPLLASLFLGTTISFVNPVYNTRELRHSLSNLNPKIVFCSLSAVNNLMEIKKDIGTILEVILIEHKSSHGLRTLDDYINSCECTIETFKPVELESNDKTAIILSSSGTTGVPKGVNITYRNLISHIPYFTHKNYIAMQRGETVVVLVPVFHIFGLLLMLYTIALSSKVVFLKRFKPELFLSSLQNHRVTKLSIVPPLAIFLAKNPIVNNYDLSSIKDIICGSAPLGQSIMDMIYQRLNVPVRQVYGLTETGALTCVPFGLTSKINTSGCAAPNVQIAIKDLNTREILSKNQRGEVCAKGPNVTNGYFRNEEATKNAFDSEGYFLTGDIGYFDEDGHLFIVDRIKELIKYKGFQVAPAELEGILLKHEAVKDVAVVGIPDETAGELPTAFIVRRPSVNVTEDALAKFVAEQVSTYKRLSGGVKFIDEIPKNAGGKILRRELKNRLAEKDTLNK